MLIQGVLANPQFVSPVRHGQKRGKDAETVPPRQSPTTAVLSNDPAQYRFLQLSGSAKSALRSDGTTLTNG
jgi:hypothetical protein